MSSPENSMKLSEFQIAVDDEFGSAYGGVVVNDLVLERVGGRTAREALGAGVAPRDVWLALCEATDVPPERRHGVGRREPEARRPGGAR
jgi:Protein of unknown function (DUF3046)